MNYEKNPIITPFVINGLILWDYVERASLYESFTMMSSDYALYTPIRFEAL